MLFGILPLLGIGQLHINGYASLVQSSPFLFSFALSIPPSSAQAEFTSSPTETVYYYIDHSRPCSPDTDLPDNIYWLITEDIHEADATDLEQVVETYKQFLDQHFTAPEAMMQDIVIRYQSSAPEAQAARVQKIEKMRSQGYTILETSFLPN